MFNYYAEIIPGVLVLYVISWTLHYMTDIMIFIHTGRDGTGLDESNRTDNEFHILIRKYFHLFPLLLWTAVDDDSGGFVQSI